MRLFHPLNSLVVTRNLRLILLSKILSFSNLVKHTSKTFQNSKDSKYALIFSLTSVVAAFLAILRFFDK